MQNVIQMALQYLDFFEKSQKLLEGFAARPVSLGSKQNLEKSKLREKKLSKILITRLA